MLIKEIEEGMEGGDINAKYSNNPRLSKIVTKAGHLSGK